MSNKQQKWYVSALLFVLSILVFLFAIDLIGSSVRALGQDAAQSFLLATSNPFIGLFIGLLATALIQSSSTVTSMVVAVVATGYLSLESAIPVVMGANVGTTLTSTLVSLGFVSNKNEFRKAISAGTIHDFFNIMVVLIMFPLEYYYGGLSFMARSLTEFFGGGPQSQVLENGIEGYTRLSEGLVAFLGKGIIALFLALILLFLSIKLLSTILYARLIGASRDRLKSYVFNNPYKSFGWGALITGGIQSSSVTTSLLVPLVASNKVKLSNAFPMVMGANIGTTITALIAAFNKSDAAISLAFVHLIFNLCGVLIFLPFPVLRRIPVLIAYKFGAYMLRSRLVGFSYIIVTFFLLPFSLIYFNKGTIENTRFNYEISSDQQKGEEKSVLIRSSNLSREIQFSIYSTSLNSDLTILPDTSWTVTGKEAVLASPFDLVSFNPKTKRFDSGIITASKDTSMASVDGHTFNSLQVIDVLFSNMDRAHVLIDKEHKLILSYTKTDTIGNSLKSFQLKSIQ